MSGVNKALSAFEIFSYTSNRKLAYSNIREQKKIVS